MSVNNTKNGGTGSFIRDNQKSLAFIAIGIVVLILLYIGYQRFYLAPRAERATNEMFKAEEYAMVDSLQNRAIDGDGSYPGFKEIAEEYSNTKSANVANAYLGGLYLRQGKYQEAVNALSKYSDTGSPIIDPLVTGLLGDAYTELKDYKKAADQYKKAASKSDNSFTAPLFLKKLGLVYEAQNDYKSALENYQKIKKDYPQSYEASIIDGYIARCEAR
ncbi:MULTISPECIES: tetratricopeptide repeat protein [Olivibacter]|uniref:Tetratricopeptide TPR_2 repeat-containing protein n=3 Tax=Sphingobacteriaceae TaxID=84566 RepID=F4C7T6_SPHS2|nr:MULTISPECIES: tetratricopeptide repeat protein [Olivibacter]MCL4638187.1 tetratricopeptide repeat protein [Olivibacter sp. UJ_SKK_5.1]MDM8173954.1 tetratricopeptide repeat protein [Olivibacter sp. 47]MDX3915139.1 tetratricopeptide repeat protein [Pseudosphingobacterium sp.]QEL03741.1 tetratricopeptide repeat protein [Olivibacter sp. LS-1]